MAALHNVCAGLAEGKLRGKWGAAAIAAIGRSQRSALAKSTGLLKGSRRTEIFGFLRVVPGYLLLLNGALGKFIVVVLSAMEQRLSDS